MSKSAQKACLAKTCAEKEMKYKENDRSSIFCFSLGSLESMCADELDIVMPKKTLLGFNAVQGFLTRAVRELVMLDFYLRPACRHVLGSFG